MQMQMNAVNTKWTDLLTGRVIDERKRDEKKMKQPFSRKFWKNSFSDKSKSMDPSNKKEQKEEEEGRKNEERKKERKKRKKGRKRKKIINGLRIHLHSKRSVSMGVK